MTKRTLLLRDTRLPERFWAKVSVDEAGCWVWTAHRNAHGYGTFQKWRGRTWLAHRLAYHELVGDLPAYVPGGPQLDHLCRNRACCNPDHLELVSPRENCLRGETIAAARIVQTECIHGHPFMGRNLIWRKDGTRACRECMNREQRESRARRASRAFQKVA